MVDWREQFEDLRQRRPEVARRVGRRLLRDLQKKKLVDLEALDELAMALSMGGKKALDPNGINSSCEMARPRVSVTPNSGISNPAARSFFTGQTMKGR